MKISKTIFCLSLLLFIASCSDDDPKNTVENGVIDAVSNGTWRVTYLYDNGVNKTSTFADYIFTFRSGDVVTAEKAPANVIGTWNISDSNGDTDILEDLNFNMEFTTPLEFEAFSDDWEITAYTLTKIELIDVNSGAATNYLTFEKN